MIETSKNASPSPLWEKFVVTGKAKASIRRFVRNERYEQFCDLGKAIFQKTLKKMSIRYSQKLLLKIMEELKYEKVEDVLAAIGEGEVSSEEILKVITPEHKSSISSNTSNVVDFNSLPFWSNYTCMQRLITIGFWSAYVVFKSTRQNRVGSVK